jgi:hypothetical protein
MGGVVGVTTAERNVKAIVNEKGLAWDAGRAQVPHKNRARWASCQVWTVKCQRLRARALCSTTHKRCMQVQAGAVRGCLGCG